MQHKTGSQEIESISRNILSRVASGGHRSPSSASSFVRRSLRIRAIVCGASFLIAAAGVHAQFGAQPVGATTGNQGVTVTATTAGTVTSVQILTLGSPSGDFAAGTGAANCASASLAQGATCTASVTFTPAAPGLRVGAVVLVGNPTVGTGPSVLGTAYLSGTGTGGLGVLVSGNLLPVAGQFGLYTAVGDGGPATQAELYLPSGIAVDGAGNLYIADSLHNRIRMVCASATSATIQGTTCVGAGIISTIAGNGNPSYTGDDGPAASATLSNPGDVALDGAGNLYIADSGNNVIRKISAATGVITTIAGSNPGAVCGSKSDAVGDGCPATQATLNQPQGVTLDASANVYIADTSNQRIREVNATTGNIATIAGNGFTNGNGTGAFNGDGIAATSAELNFPYAVAFDASGNMYIPDSANQRVREVMAVGGVITPASTISTFAGTGNAGATACTASPGCRQPGRRLVALGCRSRRRRQRLHRRDAERGHPQSERGQRAHFNTRGKWLRHVLCRRSIPGRAALRAGRSLPRRSWRPLYCRHAQHGRARDAGQLRRARLHRARSARAAPLQPRTKPLKTTAMPRST